MLQITETTKASWSQKVFHPWIHLTWSKHAWAEASDSYLSQRMKHARWPVYETLCGLCIKLFLHKTMFHSVPMFQGFLCPDLREFFYYPWGKGGEQWSSKENHLSQISSFSDRRRRIMLATDCQCWVLCPEGGQLPGSKRQPMLGFMSHRRAPPIPHAREYSTPKKDSQGWRLLRQLITDCMERIIWWTTCQHPLQYDMPDTFIETSAAFTNRSKRKIISLSRCQEPVQDPLQWSIQRPILCFTFHISRCSKCP